MLNLTTCSLRCLASRALVLSLSLWLPAVALAVPIFDEFGPLDTATFGGQGIPNEEVTISSQFVDGDVLITVAMSATQRFSNPPLTNDGAGTYFAQPGSNFGGNGESTELGALWNVNAYIAVEGTNGATPVLADYQFNLFYDFDPGLNTPIGQMGMADLTAFIIAILGDPNATVGETSQNMMFDFLSMDLPPFLTAPPVPFDPNALGEYTYGIQVSRSGWGLETVAMKVVVVPEPSTCVLAGFGLLALVAVRRRLSGRG